MGTFFCNKMFTALIIMTIYELNKNHCQSITTLNTLNLLTQKKTVCSKFKVFWEHWIANSDLTVDCTNNILALNLMHIPYSVLDEIKNARNINTKHV